METAENIKEVVREKYAAIVAQTRQQNASSCCGVGASCAPEGMDYTVFAEDYDHLKGYNPDADLGLGCGLPTEYAHIKEGDTVLDLGSGAGNDCFVARECVGETGKVLGVDMTPEMIARARENAEKRGYTNVEFRLGDIEDLPIGGNKVDVVVSNCVMNLVPNKAQAFAETFRVLRPGGHFSISDVVLRGELPTELKTHAELYAGCVAGAVSLDEYLEAIHKAGFVNIHVQKLREITLPEDLLNSLKYEVPNTPLAGHTPIANRQSVAEAYRNSGAVVFSVTVYAEKPLTQSCCAPGAGCC